MAKKILNLYLHSTRNEEHIQFHARMLQAITPELAADLNIESLREDYAARFATEDKAFIRNQAYKSTQTIADKDRERDDLFLYIKSFIESHLYCPIAEKKAAAQDLDFALSPYRDAHKRPYDGETAQIASFITDVQNAANAPHVATLGLTEALQNLRKSNEEFDALYTGRTADKEERFSADNMKQARPKVDAAYDVLTEAINALYVVNELVTKSATTATRLGEVIDKVNGFIIQMQETLARRGAGGTIERPGGEGGGDDGETPDPVLPGGGGNEGDTPDPFL